MIRVKIPKEIANVLKEFGVDDYRIEKRSKHAYLVARGERLCVLSYSQKTKPQTVKNSAARVRRTLEGRKGR